MNHADEFRATADAMEALMLAGNTARVIEMAINSLPAQVQTTIDHLIEHSLYLPIPRNRMLHLYLGASDSLGRYKVGITKDITSREKQINASLTHLAMAPDFKVLHFGYGPESIVRHAERSLLNELKPYSVGGEWFTQHDEVFDSIHVEADRMWEAYDHFLYAFDITPDINACAPGQKLYGQTPKGRREHIERLTKLSWEWVRTLQEANKIVGDRMARAKAAAMVAEARAHRQISLFEDDG